MDKLSLLKSKLPELYKDSSCEHDLSHVLRVAHFAKIIGEKEGAVLDILIPAAYLHDIAQRKLTHHVTRKTHAVLGADEARKILTEMNFDKVDEICSAIRQHSHSSLTNEKETLEGICLFDADKLDGLSIVAVARHLQLMALERNLNIIDACRVYLEAEKEIKLKTKTGKEMDVNRKEASVLCKRIIELGTVK
jgi:HD superfamily phosphodiesterase